MVFTRPVSVISRGASSRGVEHAPAFGSRLVLTGCPGDRRGRSSRLVRIASQIAPGTCRAVPKTPLSGGDLGCLTRLLAQFRKRSCFKILRVSAEAPGGAEPGTRPPLLAAASPRLLLHERRL